MHILASRWGGLGDEICLLPALDCYHIDHPDDLITLHCRFPELYWDREWITPVTKMKSGKYDKFINIKWDDKIPGAFQTSLVDVFFNQLNETPWAQSCLSLMIPKVSIPKDLMEWAEGILPKGRRRIVLAPGSGWPSRSYPRWREVAEVLLSEDISIVALGRSDYRGDNQLAGLPEVVDLVDKTTILQAGAIIKSSLLFLGNCSGLAMLATAVDTESIIMHGPTLAEYRALSDFELPIQREGLDCIGCAHDDVLGKQIRASIGVCPLGHTKCMDIEPEIVIEQVRTKIGQ